MSLVESNVRANYSGRLQTPFLNTTGKCFMISYRFLGRGDGVLRVYSKAENLSEIVIKEVQGKGKIILVCNQIV